MTIPFVNQKFVFHNPDGSEIEVLGWGDEHSAIFETLDGFTVTKDQATGFYQYAMLSQDKSALLPSGARVGSLDPRSIGLMPKLRATPASMRVGAMAARAALGGKRRWEIRREERRSKLSLSLMRAAPLTAPPTQTRIGTYLGLCLLIQFPDVPGTIAQQEVANFCNKRGYNGYGNNGSVFDYYYDNSCGRLNYTNIVTAYYTSRHPRSYYTDPAVPYGTRAQELIREALDQLKAQHFNFGALSSDEGGYIYALNVFYAGEIANNWSEGLWPHSWGLGSYDAGNGKKFSDYQITNMGSQLTLATFCHENGHMLCDFPDFYDYGYESAGNGNFCLMAYGGGDSRNPVEVCGYLKYKAGWANQATTITDGMTATIPAGQNRFYLYPNPNRATEYFIIENLQKTGRDVSLPDAGLAIWHIDELGSNNLEQMTLSQHYECSLEQADNQFHLEHGGNFGDSNDLFGGPSARQFTRYSSPASKWWDGSDSGLNIIEISEPGAVMTFMQADPQAPFAKQLCVARNADGRLEVLSIGTNNRIYHNWQVAPNSGWHGGLALGGEARQVAAGGNADGRCELFYVGMDNNIYHSWQVTPNGAWRVAKRMQGQAKQIAVKNNADGRQEIFYIGTNDRIYHNWQTALNSGWSGEAAMGGWARQIAVGRNADGRLETFYVSLNNKIYHNWQVAPNSGWSGEAMMGGDAKQLAVGQNADGRLEIFFIGVNSRIYHIWQVSPNGGWSAPAPMGGQAKQLTVGRNADGRQEVFYVGLNDRIYHNWQVSPNGGWSGEQPLPGWARQIEVGINADGRQEIFYVGLNTRMYHNWQVMPNGGWSGENQL